MEAPLADDQPPTEPASRRPGVPSLLAVVATIAVVAAVAAGLGMLADDTAPEPAVTPTATPTLSPTTPTESPTTASPTPTEPTASPTPTPAATPSPTPTALPALEGSARVEDAEGDVTDPDGQPPADPVPAADLAAVALDGDGETLRITFELAGPLPPSARSLLWSVDVRLDGELAYTVTVQQLDDQLYTGVLDWQSPEAQPTLGSPVIDGASLRVTVPARLLSRLDRPFTWSALGQQDDSYEDRVPDNGNGDLPTFPS